MIESKLKYHRASAQKVRQVVSSFRLKGMPVYNAINVLKFSNKKAAAIIKKVMVTAIADAEHNYNKDVDDLLVLNVLVDSAGFMKRMKARAKGSGNRIKRPIVHVTVVLGDKG